MALEIPRQCSKWLTITGSFLLLCPLGVMWLWGNLSVYAMSYVIKNGDDSSDVMGPWVVSSQDIACPIGILLSSMMIKKCGKKVSAVFGVTVSAFGFAISYFTVGTNALLMKILLGVTTGFGLYNSLGVVITYSAEWADGDFGFINGLTQSGISTGPLALNMLVTFYINPDNLVPDTSFGPLRYFSQDEVLNKVPSLFLILAGVVIATSFVSMVMMRDRNKGHSKDAMLNYDDDGGGGGCGNDVVGDVDNVARNHFDNDSTAIKICKEKQYQEGQLLLQKKNENKYGSIASNSNVIRYYPKTLSISTVEIQHETGASNLVGTASNISVDVGNSNMYPNVFEVDNVKNPRDQNPKSSHPVQTEHLFSKSYEASKASGTISNHSNMGNIDHEEKNTENVELDKMINTQPEVFNNNQSPDEIEISWRQVLQTARYYHYCILWGIGSATYVVGTTYYKSYGQVFIHDDHFLTGMSIPNLIGVSVSKLLWGKLLDCLGAKLSFVAYFSTSAIACICFYFSPMINRWLYLTVTMFFLMNMNSIIILVSYTCYKVYGTSNVTFAFGMVTFPMTVGMMILSRILQFVLESQGWFVLIICCASWNIFGLIFSILVLPREL